MPPEHTGAMSFSSLSDFYQESWADQPWDHNSYIYLYFTKLFLHFLGLGDNIEANNDILVLLVAGRCWKPGCKSHKPTATLTQDGFMTSL